MVLEAMSQPLKEAELSQIAQLQFVNAYLKAHLLQGSSIAETNSGVLSHADC